MFGLSFGEIFIIGIVALLVLGPERLPKVARTVGHLMGRAQRYMRDVKNDIQREIDLKELSEMKNNIEDAAHDMKNKFTHAVSDIKKPLNALVDDVQDTAEQLKKEMVDDAAQELKEVVVQDMPDLSSEKSKIPALDPEITSPDKSMS